MLEICNATKRIRGVLVLNSVSLHLEQGHVYGLWGSNGSGKTMLLRAICGLITLSDGSISTSEGMLGRDFDFLPSVGALIEYPCFLDHMTGIDNLKLIASIKSTVDEDEIRAVLLDVGLDPDDRRKVKKYSLGMRQKLGIACAIMEKPEVLLLDEPFNALDSQGIGLAMTCIEKRKQEGSLVIIASHDKGLLQIVADQLLVLECGSIVGQVSCDEKEKNNEVH